MSGHDARHDRRAPSPCLEEERGERRVEHAGQSQRLYRGRLDAAVNNAGSASAVNEVCVRAPCTTGRGRDYGAA